MLQAEKMAKGLFTVDEYYRMAEAGILSEDDRVELLEGEIVEVAAIGSRRAACVKRPNELLGQRVAEETIVRVQSPIRLLERTEPEPDLALLGPRDDYYAGGHPGPEDVLLVVEVAETSGEYDSDVKLPLYARAGIPEAWIVDLTKERIEVHSRPVDGEYRETARSRRGETVASQAAPELSAADILG